MYKVPKLSLINAIGVSILSIAQFSYAQQATSQASPLDQIVVTSKSGQSLADVLPTSHVFDLAAIEATQSTDLPELLDQLTGLSINGSGGRGSTTGVFLRGLSSSQTIVLIDGVRVGSATLGAAALNSYPVEAIERIEVVKGPLSGLYGADAASGVIQLFTKKGTSGLSAISVTGGSDSLREANAGIQGGDDKASFHIGAHVEETDGIDNTSIITDGNDDRDAYQETAFSFGGKLTLSPSTVAQLSVLYTDNTVEFDNTFGADPGLETDTKTLSSALNIKTKLSDTITWTSTLGINSDEAITNGAFPSDISTDRDSIGTELSFNLNNSSSIVTGLDYYQEEIETLSDFPVTERDNSGAFVLLQSSIGKFGFVGNLRYDDNSAYGSDTNSSLALNYNFTDSTRIVASYGTAFSAPSFNFLYFPFFGNPDLLPEESDSYELSLLNISDSVNWRISAYKTDVINLFSFDPQTFLAANIGEAEIEGVEFELSTQFADWDFALNLDFLTAENAVTGIELDDRAERTLSAKLSRSFGDFDLGFNLKSEDGRFDNNGTELDNYTLLDIVASYQFNDSLSILANIDNVFDKDYTVNLIGSLERFNTQGRQSKLTLKYNF